MLTYFIFSLAQAAFIMMLIQDSILKKHNFTFFQECMFFLTLIVLWPIHALVSIVALISVLMNNKSDK